MTDDAQDTAPVVHRIRWFVYVDGKRIPRTATMRGSWPGFDATCSCGWDTRTGGAVRNYIRFEVWSHKQDHAHEQDHGVQSLTSDLDDMPARLVLSGDPIVVRCDINHNVHPINAGHSCLVPRVQS